MATWDDLICLILRLQHNIFCLDHWTCLLRIPSCFLLNGMKRQKLYLFFISTIPTRKKKTIIYFAGSFKFIVMTFFWLLYLFKNKVIRCVEAPYKLTNTHRPQIKSCFIWNDVTRNLKPRDGGQNIFAKKSAKLPVPVMKSFCNERKSIFSYIFAKLTIFASNKKIFLFAYRY